MFGFGKTDTEFEEREARIRQANADLRASLADLRNAAGTDGSHVLLFTVGSAGMATLPEAITTLMACVDALSARVAILENQ